MPLSASTITCMGRLSSQPFLIADTSALISLTSVADRNHAAAVAASEDLSSEQATILVPYDVLAETINMIGKKEGHAKAVDVAQLLSSTPPFVVIDSATQTRQAALARFATLPQSVSYTDAVVMSCADTYETTRIFGFDEAFAKNGYHIIGKEAPVPAA